MAQYEIIERIRKGDRSAFNELCRERYASLISYARLFLNGHWAEDVVQDVLFGVWQNRRTLDSETNLQAYLIRSVYNRSMNYLASDRRSRMFADSYQLRIATLIAESYSPDHNPTILGLYNMDIRQRLETAIQSLSPRCREVFTLSYVEHMSEKEIAERLGLSLSTVENHMYMALKQLRISLKEI